MRYDVIHDDRDVVTHYLYDNWRGILVGNSYVNKYVAQTECDRLNGIEGDV